jgi:hypothetical protein
MSGTPGDKTYAKRQRQPFETPAGERAFKVAAMGSCDWQWQ